MTTAIVQEVNDKLYFANIKLGAIYIMITEIGDDSIKATVLPNTVLLKALETFPATCELCNDNDNAIAVKLYDKLVPETENDGTFMKVIYTDDMHERCWFIPLS